MKRSGLMISIGLGVLLSWPARPGAQWLESHNLSLTATEGIRAGSPDIIAGAQDKAADARACNANGDRAYRAGDYANAIVFFSKAIDLDPRSSYARFWRAWAYLKTGGRPGYDSALADVTKFIELDPADKSIYFARGEIYRYLAHFALDKGDRAGADALLAKALADYQVALGANPNSPVIPVSIGAAAAAKGDLGGALAAYAGVLEREPDNRELPGHLRDLFQLYYERKEEIDCGTFKRAWHLAGGFYADKREYASAIKCFSRALELGLTELSVYWARARAYENAGDLAKALADAGVLVKFPPPSSFTYRFRAGIYDKKGDLDKAIEDYSEAIRLQWKSIKELDRDEKDVEYLELRAARAAVYYKMKEWNKAIGDFQYVSDNLRPGRDKAKILHNIGTAYDKKGDARNAQKYFQQAEAMESGLKK